MILPGKTVYIELPMPRVEGACPATVRAIGIRKVALRMGLMSGWYPRSWIGRTCEEAEAKRAAIDAAEHSQEGERRG